MLSFFAHIIGRIRVSENLPPIHGKSDHSGTDESPAGFLERPHETYWLFIFIDPDALKTQ